MATSVQPMQPGRALAPQPISPASPQGMSSPALSPTTGPSLVAREWVIPPRPKPGRKPATDTPPTKRKAQNRAAQRAFRERRAAKVGELEAQMDEMEREHEDNVEALHVQMEELERKLDQRLRDAVIAYENDLKNLGQELTTWKIRSQDLEGLVLEERRKRANAEKDLEAIKSGGVPVNSMDSKGSDSETRQEMLDAQQAYQTPPEIPIGCGRCTPFSRCQCAEEVFGMPTGSGIDDASAPKRALSPTNSQEEPSKRAKQEDNTEGEQSLETDFTNFHPPQLPFTTSTSSMDSLTATAAVAPPLEPCGFCQDGSACLCAELAAGQSQITEGAPQFLSQDTPAPTSSNQPITLHPIKGSSSSISGCSSNPGTCTKCRSDATSTLLCKTLNATQPAALQSVSSDAQSSEPCPLGAACCRVSKTIANLPSTYNASSSSSTTLLTSTLGTLQAGQSQGQIQAITGPTISCADAFTTLSRHPAFERASKDLGEWLPRLVTIPAVRNHSNENENATLENDNVEGSSLAEATPATSTIVSDTAKAPLAVHPNLGGRTAFDIEAASVMGVLRMFDRRFGKDAK